MKALKSGMISFLILMFFAGNAMAIVITPTQNTTSLTNALIDPSGSGMTNISLTLFIGQSTGSDVMSSGTFTNESETYTIGNGIVLSTGSVEDYEDGDNDSPPSKSTNYGGIYSPFPLLEDITGLSYSLDVTQIDIVFDMLIGFNAVTFDVVFGSEEFPEYGATDFKDGFGIFLNNENIAYVNGAPINSSHEGMQEYQGTELNGILVHNDSPVLTFTGLVDEESKGNKLTFVLGDTADFEVDTTVFISSLKGSPIPEPGTVMLLGVGMIGLVGFKRKLKGRKTI